MDPDSMMAGLDEEDPRSLGRFMRKMGSEMGEDLGDEFDEVVGRLGVEVVLGGAQEAEPFLGDFQVTGPVIGGGSALVVAVGCCAHTTY